MTEQRRTPADAAEVDAQSTPLAHDEPIDAHSDEHDASGGHHEEPRVGPIDWPAWGYAAAGVVIALVLVYAFWVAAY